MFDAGIQAATAAGGSAGSAAVDGVLVTGANGFVGACLVRHLLRDDSPLGGGTVFALVRDSSDASAWERMEAALGRFGVSADDVAAVRTSGRLVVLSGDVGRDRFGLDDHAYSDLGARVGTIIHAV